MGVEEGKEEEEKGVDEETRVGMEKEIGWFEDEEEDGIEEQESARKPSLRSSEEERDKAPGLSTKMDEDIEDDDDGCSCCRCCARFSKRLCREFSRRGPLD